MRAISLLCLALLAGAGSPALAGPLAYVPNEKSATVSVIDTVNDRRLRVAASPSARFRYLAAGTGLALLESDLKNFKKYR